LALVAIGVAVNRTPREWSNLLRYHCGSEVKDGYDPTSRSGQPGLGAEGDVPISLPRTGCNQADAAHGLPGIGCLRSRGGSVEPQLLAPYHHEPRGVDKGGIGVYGRSYKMRRTRMRPSRWMMVSSVREGGPNSKGFSQSTKGHYRGPRLLPAGRAEKGSGREYIIG
jgi:hypothetical protein